MKMTLSDRLYFLIDDYTVTRNMKRAYYSIKNRFFMKYYLIDTDLKRDQWHDTDSKMLYGMMKLLVDYVEGEEPFTHINWDSDEGHVVAAKEIKEIYNWWKNYDNRQTEISVALNNWYENSFSNKEDVLEQLNRKHTPEVQQLFDHHTQLEEALLKEEEEMLIRLVKVRGFMWT